MFRCEGFALTFARLQDSSFYTTPLNKFQVEDHVGFERKCDFGLFYISFKAFRVFSTTRYVFVFILLLGLSSSAILKTKIWLDFRFVKFLIHFIA